MPAWTFPTAEQTAELLRLAGFVEIDAVLRTTPAIFPDNVTFRSYLRTLALHDLENSVLDEVARQLEDRTIDYVRLEVDARKSFHASYTNPDTE